MAAEFEPDREWKEQERRRIKCRLQNLASEAKTNYENRRGREPDRGPLFEAEYDKAIQELKKVAMDEYQKSIRKERQRRQAEATGSNQQDIAPMAFYVDAIPPTVDWQQQGIINEKACDRTRADSREDSKVCSDTLRESPVPFPLQSPAITPLPANHIAMPHGLTPSPRPFPNQGTTAPGLATPPNVDASSLRTQRVKRHAPGPIDQLPTPPPDERADGQGHSHSHAAPPTAAVIDNLQRDIAKEKHRQKSAERQRAGWDVQRTDIPMQEPEGLSVFRKLFRPLRHPQKTPKSGSEAKVKASTTRSFLRPLFKAGTPAAPTPPPGPPNVGTLSNSGVEKHSRAVGERGRAIPQPEKGEGGDPLKQEALDFRWPKPQVGNVGETVASKPPQDMDAESIFARQKQQQLDALRLYHDAVERSRQIKEQECAGLQREEEGRNRQVILEKRRVRVAEEKHKRNGSEVKREAKEDGRRRIERERKTGKLRIKKERLEMEEQGTMQTEQQGTMEQGELPKDEQRQPCAKVEEEAQMQLKENQPASSSRRRREPVVSQHVGGEGHRYKERGMKEEYNQRPRGQEAEQSARWFHARSTTATASSSTTQGYFHSQSAGAGIQPPNGDKRHPSATATHYSAARSQENGTHHQKAYRNGQHEWFPQGSGLAHAPIMSEYESNRIVRTYARNQKLRSELKTKRSLRWDDIPWPLGRIPFTPDDITPWGIESYLCSPHYPDRSQPEKERLKRGLQQWRPNTYYSQFLARIGEEDRAKVDLGIRCVVAGLSTLLDQWNNEEDQLNDPVLQQFEGSRVAFMYMRNERMWKAMKEKSSLTWQDLPWPVSRTPTSPEDITPWAIEAYLCSPYYPDQSRTEKDRLLGCLKQWHPDRFNITLLPKVVSAERIKVSEGVINVVVGLNHLLDSWNGKGDIELESDAPERAPSICPPLQEPSSTFSSFSTSTFAAWATFSSSNFSTSFLFPPGVLNPEVDAWREADAWSFSNGEGSVAHDDVDYPEEGWHAEPDTVREDASVQAMATALGHDGKARGSQLPSCDIGHYEVRTRMESQLELHQLSLDMVLRLELEIGEMRRKLGQSYGGIVPRSVFKKEQRRLRSNHRARMRALKGHKERERAMRVLERSKMSTAPTNADQRSTGQTPGLHPVLRFPVNGAPQGEDDLSQDKAASPISGGAAEDLFDDQEDDSASEYDDALSWFNEADVLWTKEQLAAAGTPMASTSEEAAENMIREPMVSVERDGERPWYAKIEPEDYHGLPHHDVASIIIEEESEEEEETCVLESLPALQSKSHTASHWPLDTTASLKNQRPSSRESGPPRSKEPQRHPNSLEGEPNGSPLYLNVPPRKLHHPRPRHQSQPSAPHSHAKSSLGQRPQQHGASSTSRRSSSTFEGAEAVEVTGGSFVAASTSSIVNNTYNYHYNTTTNHFCGHGTPSQPCCRQCRSHSL